MSADLKRFIAIVLMLAGFALICASPYLVQSEPFMWHLRGFGGVYWLEQPGLVGGGHEGFVAYACVRWMLVFGAIAYSMIMAGVYLLQRAKENARPPVRLNTNRRPRGLPPVADVAGMIPFLKSIEQKPLAIAVLALVVSLPLLAFVAEPSQSRSGQEFTVPWQLIVNFCLALALGMLALVGLIRAEKRGYSSTTIGLSVTALFFAFVPVAFAGLRLLTLFIRW